MDGVEMKMLLKTISYLKMESWHEKWTIVDQLQQNQ